MKEKIIHFILRYLGPKLICLLGCSIGFRWVNDRIPLERGKRNEGCIFCFWHNRFLLMPYIYQRIRFGRNICVLASRSRDGQYISDVLDGFGFAVARGSSSRSGDVAIKEMASRLKSGMDAAVTPDGPRGPRYRVQLGVILLSQLSGVPIVPVAYDVSHKARLRSWDRFIVSLPFSRGTIIFGDPVYIEEGADDEARQSARKRLEEAMRAMDLQAASQLGISAD